MRFFVRHLAWLILLFYLLGGGAVFAAPCAPAGRALCAADCVAAQAGCGGPAEPARCDLCIDTVPRLPVLKSMVRPLRVPAAAAALLPTPVPVPAAAALLPPRFSPVPAESRPLLAQRQLRTVVLLN